MLHYTISDNSEFTIMMKKLLAIHTLLILFILNSNIGLSQTPPNPPEMNNETQRDGGGGGVSDFHKFPCYEEPNARGKGHYNDNNIGIGTYVEWTAEEIHPLSVTVTLNIKNLFSNTIIETHSKVFDPNLFTQEYLGEENSMSYVANFGKFRSSYGYAYEFEYHIESDYGPNGIYTDTKTYIGYFTTNSCLHYENNTPAIVETPIVYPNPSTTSISPTVSYDINYQTAVKIEVYNTIGYHHYLLPEMVQEAGHYELRLPNTLSNGVYYVKITTWNKSEIFTLIINSPSDGGIW